MPATSSGYRPAKILTYAAPDEWPTNTNGPGTCARSSKVRRSVVTATPSCSAEAGSLQPRPARSYAQTLVSGASAVEIHPQ